MVHFEFQWEWVNDIRGGSGLPDKRVHTEHT